MPLGNTWLSVEKNLNAKSVSTHLAIHRQHTVGAVGNIFFLVFKIRSDSSVEWFVLWLDNRNLDYSLWEGTSFLYSSWQLSDAKPYFPRGTKQFTGKLSRTDEVYSTLSPLLCIYCSMWMKAEPKQLFGIIVNLLLSMTICNSWFYDFHMIWTWKSALVITFIHYFNTQEGVTSNSGRIWLNHLRPKLQLISTLGSSHTQKVNYRVTL